MNMERLGCKWNVYSEHGMFRVNMELWVNNETLRVNMQLWVNTERLG